MGIMSNGSHNMNNTTKEKKKEKFKQICAVLSLVCGIGLVIVGILILLFFRNLVDSIIVSVSLIFFWIFLYSMTEKGLFMVILKLVLIWLATFLSTCSIVHTILASAILFLLNCLHPQKIGIEGAHIWYNSDIFLKIISCFVFHEKYLKVFGSQDWNLGILLISLLENFLEKDAET